MWAIRFLTGALTGQEIPLQEGKYILGRGEDCQITIPDSGISKKHAELEVDGEGVIVTDLQSSNGTFINGVKIQESEVHNKDKVSLCETTFDIVPAREQSAVPAFPPTAQPPPPTAGGGGAPPAHYAGYPPPQGLHPTYSSPAHSPAYSPQGATPNPDEPAEDKPLKLTLKNWFTNYMDKVVLPGVYKLPEWVEFKWVIGGLMVFFVVMMTCLSAFPLIRILNSSVEQESMNHAESIAATLARMNYDTIKSQVYSAVSVEYALRRPGVTKAFVINATSGKIIAPSELAHSYSSMPFVNKGRKKDEKSVEKIDSNTVAAMAPIQFYNTKTNAHSAQAFAVVVYDTGNLTFGNKRTISLLVQTCFIALVLGIIIFFFLYKMIEFPVVSLNRQLQSALKDDSLTVETNYDFTPLKNLTTNINSALSRIASAEEAGQSMGEYDRMTEMNHIIEMIGYPTLGIDMESMKIQGASPMFEEETGVSTERILNCAVQDIDDQALKLNLTNLLDRVRERPDEIAADSLEFSGVEFQLSAKGVYGTDGPAYAVISFIPATNEQEEAG